MEIGAEGNPIKLGERRTLSFSNRKIIIGSTPIFAATSHVLKAYAESDQRVFECPCPSCGAYIEILWPQIQWQPDKPETAQWCCPSCGVFHDEGHKASMVSNGRWRVTKPDVQGHAGFRINALVSLLPNACWPRLAAEFLQAKNDPTALQAFVNTILAQPWDEAEMVDEADLITRVLPIGLDRLPDEALVIVAGIDVQDDRLEISLVAFDRHDVAYVLSHIVIWGSPDDDTLWQELDELLKTRWRHPYGGSIGIDATAIDSGDGEWTARVYDFCWPRTSRRVMAIKGMYGSRPLVQRSKGKVGTRKDGRGGGYVWIAGVDVIKTTLFNRLQRGAMIRFSDTLEPVYFEQLASEKLVVRYSRGQPVRRFERVSGRARAEALDCLVYSFAARKAVPVQWQNRENVLRGQGTIERPSYGKMLADRYGRRNP